MKNFPVFVVSAMWRPQDGGIQFKETDYLIDGDIFAMNRVYQAFTVARPSDEGYPHDLVGPGLKYEDHKAYIGWHGGGKRGDWVYSSKAWEDRLRERIAYDETKWNRIDLGRPTLFDVEYLNPLDVDDREDLIDIGHVWKRVTNHGSTWGFFGGGGGETGGGVLPRKGPYWSTRQIEKWADDNAAMMADEEDHPDIVTMVNFCSPWCHPVDKRQWSDARWKRIYRSHIAHIVALCARYQKLCYPNLPPNYNPASKHKRNEVLEPGRLQWMLQTMHVLGADGVIIDQSSDASRIEHTSAQWGVIRDFATGVTS